MMWHTVNAQIFVDTIFRGLNVCVDKFSWVVVAHEKLAPRKTYNTSTRDGMA